MNAASGLSARTRLVQLAFKDALPFSGIYGDARGAQRVRLLVRATARGLVTALREHRLRSLLRSWRHRAWDGVTGSWRHGQVSVPAVPARVAACDTPRPLRITAIVSSYGLEGAPAAVLDILVHLRERHGARVRVVSPEDGPLRARAVLRGLDAVVEPGIRLAGDSADECVARLARLGLGDEADLVIGGSLAASIAVPLAAVRGLPSLLYVQESLRIDQAVPALFAGADPRQARRVVLGALRGATRVCFTAEATRAMFAGHDRGHFRALPDVIDADAVVARARQISRAEIRRRHGVPVEATVLLCVGTVCHRKGQRVLVEALGRMRQPPHELSCLMVGLRETPELALDVEGVRAVVKREGLTDVVRLIPARDPREFFAMADIYICPSLNEAFPRAVLEAMAFDLPIVASRTAGIVEQLDQRSAWLCEPGSPDALCAALESCLLDRAEATRRGAAAGIRVREMFAAGPGLERHAQLVFETASAGRARGDTR